MYGRPRRGRMEEIMAIFTGAGVALVTPMNQDGSVNYDKLKEVIEQQIAGHTDAIIICGTTGELLLLRWKSISSVSVIAAK